MRGRRDSKRRVRVGWEILSNMDNVWHKWCDYVLAEYNIILKNKNEPIAV